MPLAALVDASAVGDGLAMTAAAILGKFLSGAWAAPLVTKEGCARRPFWVGWLQAGSRSTGRLATGHPAGVWSAHPGSMDLH